MLQPSFVHAAEKLDLQYSVQRRQIRFQLSARNCAQSKRVTLELSNAATGERHALDAECFSASPPWVHGHISPGTWSATLVTDEPASFEDEPKWWPGMVRARVFSGLVVP